ncbi:hypothetical protein BurJ1DRAFT_1143 [Burkholderiales bacterium JOSHI_001]|nr:hypothetical protein BurJ1DRAFT_1143 [Burkholderiales bacterium JOSHI_001]
MRFQNSVVSAPAPRRAAKQSPSARQAVATLALAIAGLLAVAGCGQKGPLTLPAGKTPAGAASAPAR